MKRKMNIFIMILLMFTLVSCKNNEPIDNDGNGGDVLPPVQEEVKYEYEGTLTKAPYTAYNADGSEIGEHLYLFDAIREAGLNGKSTNITYVLDDNGLQVFKRQAKNNYHLYDGMHYVGSKSAVESLVWAETRSKSYVLDGQGVGFVKLGMELFEGSDIPEHIELNAGGYNYMFSKQGEMKSGIWEKEGYAYAKTTVRLSEATYQVPKDGQWNAYIFINHSGTFNSDLGLIGNLIDGEIKWRLVRNCSHTSHAPNGDGFKVLSDIAVTSMALDENGEYSGADDLEFEVISTVDGWDFTITNLANKQKFYINEHHKGMHEGETGYFRMLLAASLVPVTGNVWNARNGSYLKNVIFEDIKIARYNKDNVYTEEMLEEFYPGEKNVLTGFSYAADTANHIFDTHKEDGKYLSGEPYKKGSKYLSFSSFYDGSERVVWKK